MPKKVYEMKWKCAQCAHDNIPGLVKKCPTCGDPRNTNLSPSERPYLPSDARELTDKDELARAHAGKDWTCGFCGECNDGNFANCTNPNCARPRDADDTVGRTITYTNDASHYDIRPNPLDEMIEDDIAAAERKVHGQLLVPRELDDLTLPSDQLPTSADDVVVKDPIGDEIEQRWQEQERMRDLPPILQKVFPYRKQIKLGAIILAIVLALAIGITLIVKVVHYYTATVAGIVTITELDWERSVDIEQYRTISRGDWDYPSDARNISSYQKIYTYETVYDHTEIEQFTDHRTEYESRDTTYECNIRTVENSNGTATVESDICHRTESVPHDVSFPNTRSKDVYREEPRYRTWYDYQVDRWIVDRAATASGKTSNQVYWPEPTGLRDNGIPGDQVGEERVGDGRHSIYTIIYNDSNNVIHVDNVKESLWQSVEVGKTIPARYYERNGTLASVDWESSVVEANTSRGTLNK